MNKRKTGSEQEEGFPGPDSDFKTCTIITSPSALQQVKKSLAPSSGSNDSVPPEHTGVDHPSRNLVTLSSRMEIRSLKGRGQKVITMEMQCKRPRAGRRALILKLTCCRHHRSKVHWDKQMHWLKKGIINSVFSRCKLEKWSFFFFSEGYQSRTWVEPNCSKGTQKKQKRKESLSLIFISSGWLFDLQSLKCSVYCPLQLITVICFTFSEMFQGRDDGASTSTGCE